MAAGASSVPFSSGYPCRFVQELLSHFCSSLITVFLHAQLGRLCTLNQETDRFFHPKTIHMFMVKALSFVREMDFKSVRLRMQLDTSQPGAVSLPVFSAWFTELCVTPSFFLWIGFHAATNCMSTLTWEFAEGLLEEIKCTAFAQ